MSITLPKEGPTPAEISPRPSQKALVGIREVFNKYKGQDLNEVKNMVGDDRTALLTHFRELAQISQKDKKHGLTALEKKFLSAFKKNYRDFIESNLKTALEQQLQAGSEKHDKELAKMLGLDKDPIIATLLMDPHAQKRRTLGRLAFYTVGSLALGSAAGAVVSLTRAGKEQVKAPGPKPPAQPKPEVLVASAASTDPLPPSSPTPEPPETSLTVAKPPRGFTSSSSLILSISPTFP